MIFPPREACTACIWGHSTQRLLPLTHAALLSEVISRSSAGRLLSPTHDKSDSSSPVSVLVVEITNTINGTGVSFDRSRPVHVVTVILNVCTPILQLGYFNKQQPLDSFPIPSIVVWRSVTSSAVAHLGPSSGDDCCRFSANEGRFNRIHKSSSEGQVRRTHLSC